ncbi:molybdopterin-guanine dinucleotide biosynthesis protein B [Methyloceanibacter sp.]|uniref:molybdopterin-guanine dinucleotide biosynthesis protein B n=1 Tax=Methyloceanibacter sp. TaxID=1965321 RepID=UPI002D5DB39F|nr:molybdopterin-guanine dinucleotide biosynthesis protein B [Methyloceanibacter sp.]HZP09737.1 molybdopterin-guanine dinucleotide biosynthesis protein B [Methyloceanibacter sp.]
MKPPLFGVAGWKNSGKTTLMANLVAELSGRGLVVSVIKHAHERFDIDHPGRDSFKLREAGAAQIALSSPRRFALMRELRGEPELVFADICRYLGPCDLVLVEGFKRENFPKIEIRREGAASREPLLGTFPGIVALASDRPEAEVASLPTFHLDDKTAIADFIIEHLDVKSP